MFSAVVGFGFDESVEFEVLDVVADSSVGQRFEVSFCAVFSVCGVYLSGVDGVVVEVLNGFVECSVVVGVV